MKTQLPQFLLILAIFLSVSSFAQTGNQYLFVEIRGLSAQRGVPELKKELDVIKAINSIEYCEKAGLLILHSENSIEAVRSEVNQLLHSLNYKYTIKSAIPIEEARKICSKNSPQ